MSITMPNMHVALKQTFNNAVDIRFFGDKLYVCKIEEDGSVLEGAELVLDVLPAVALYGTGKATLRKLVSDFKLEGINVDEWTQQMEDDFVEEIQSQINLPADEALIQILQILEGSVEIKYEIILSDDVPEDLSAMTATLGDETTMTESLKNGKFGQTLVAAGKDLNDIKGKVLNKPVVAEAVVPPKITKVDVDDNTKLVVKTMGAFEKSVITLGPNNLRHESGDVLGDNEPKRPYDITVKLYGPNNALLMKQIYPILPPLTFKAPYSKLIGKYSNHVVYTGNANAFTDGPSLTGNNGNAFPSPGEGWFQFVAAADTMDKYAGIPYSFIIDQGYDFSKPFVTLIEYEPAPARFHSSRCELEIIHDYDFTNSSRRAQAGATNQEYDFGFKIDPMNWVELDGQSAYSYHKNNKPARATYKMITKGSYGTENWKVDHLNGFKPELGFLGFHLGVMVPLQDQMMGLQENSETHGMKRYGSTGLYGLEGNFRSGWHGYGVLEGDAALHGKLLHYYVFMVYIPGTQAGNTEANRPFCI